LFVVDGSRLYDLDQDTAAHVEAAMAAGESHWIEDLGLLREDRSIGALPPDPPPVHSISLNLAQVCNLSCGYCYADEGRFSGDARLMSVEVARETVNFLLDSSRPGTPVVLGFMGGEPLLNKPALHQATHYAWDLASSRGHEISFSITTNGTLIGPAEAKLFHEFPFSVQISLDGAQAANDESRPMKDGTSSYRRILQGLELVNSIGRPRQFTARASITRQSGRLGDILDHLLSLGFDDAGFAPVVVSPEPALRLTEADFTKYLAEMIECGEKAMCFLTEGRPYPFSNLMTAIEEIHKGTCRPYPCGAGAAYLSASAEGDLFACHRTIDNGSFRMGAIDGLDHQARARLLRNSHVDQIEPCRTCWARYLCGGGCYHEVALRGRPGCDFIRGWLDFCLKAYIQLCDSAGSARLLGR
jgi:uncharacterized protein